MKPAGVGSWLPYALLLGLFLTCRGYRSFEGDQAYRFPLLLHRQDPGLFADDPFVRSFDQFNPHRGSLALLDAISHPFGLPAGLFLVFVLTFLGTCRAVNRLGGSAWAGGGPAAGWVAVGLFLLARAGNIGTNHLFEPMVLDRLVALALGWQAIADAIARPTGNRWPSSLWIGLAAIVHPSVGLQLALLLAASWLAWAGLGRISGVRLSTAWRVAASMGLAVLPGLAVNLAQRSTLQGDLPDDIFWILSVELQSPQHMLPHLWRMPQWLAWFAYLALAGLQLAQARSRPGTATEAEQESAAARRRLTIMLGVLGAGLAASWFAIEVVHSIRATVFQPFRMSTVARGLALAVVAGRLARLWRSGGWLGRTRSTVLATGFLGDWSLVVATVAELSVSAVEAFCEMVRQPSWLRGTPALVYAAMMSLGLNFLGHHDTESGHIPMMIAVTAGLMVGSGLVARHRDGDGSRLSRRLIVATGLAWVVPASALLASFIPWQHPTAQFGIVRGLVDRCRFAPIPRDDIERLALWCREQTPESARFIGPPGPKTFRLWSRRSLAFNRSGSPYHGAGLADWFARFQDHVDHHGTPDEFVRAYREHRHEFESRYDGMSDAQRAALAVRQGAGYIIAEASGGAAAGSREDRSGPLELLHVEGRYAVYRVRPSVLVHRQP